MGPVLHVTVHQSVIVAVAVSVHEARGDHKPMCVDNSRGVYFTDFTNLNDPAVIDGYVPHVPRVSGAVDYSAVPD